MCGSGRHLCDVALGPSTSAHELPLNRSRLNARQTAPTVTPGIEDRKLPVASDPFAKAIGAGSSGLRAIGVATSTGDPESLRGPNPKEGPTHSSGNVPLVKIKCC